MQEMVVPAALHKFRDQHRNLLVRTTPLRFENVLHNRREDQTIPGRQEHELGSDDSGLLGWRFDVAVPLLLKGRRPFSAIDVNGADVRRDLESEADCSNSVMSPSHCVPFSFEMVTTFGRSHLKVKDHFAKRQSLEGTLSANRWSGPRLAPMPAYRLPFRSSALGRLGRRVLVVTSGFAQRWHRRDCHRPSPRRRIARGRKC